MQNDYEIFLKFFGPLVDTHPMNPALIECDGQPDAYCVSGELHETLIVKARAFDEQNSLEGPVSGETVTVMLSGAPKNATKH